MNAKEEFPHLAWLVKDEHDSTGEIEKALDKIDEQEIVIGQLRDELVESMADAEYWRNYDVGRYD